MATARVDAKRPPPSSLSSPSLDLTRRLYTQASAPAAPPDSSWPEPSTTGRCVILYEPIPLPGLVGRSGRLSFGPGVAKQPPQQGASAAGAAPASAPGSTAAPSSSQPGTSVSDVDMAQTFRKPGELRAWQPSNLRLYDEPGGAGDGGSGGQAPAPATAAKQQRAGGGGSGGGGAGGSGKKGKSSSQASPAANAFAPLRPPKRPKA
ncbi:hypothetical protein TSOC_006263 [Tetrabaena socialis]|uniref:Uncharacterized protein n=1 Tax=Tetrabaena socialis TaxID=47790 RepID=A0A2J8A451_9CHLO|nr:hypothetical protein TSOC_006263 [Tetrabaena socialis]|eukprot:PNH07296.1 hypothetical protein TSOC_006263 [Tetrabaena socialis]